MRTFWTVLVFVVMGAVGVMAQEETAGEQQPAETAPPAQEGMTSEDVGVLPPAGEPVAVSKPAFSPSYRSPNPPPSTRKVDDHWSAYTAPPVPEGVKVHLIQAGDTFWDLAHHYYGDPYVWPQLWEKNSYILDPHWIYPGDPIFLEEIRLITPGGIAEAVHEATRLADEMQPPAMVAPSGPQDKMFISLRDQPVLEATYDEVYCSFYLDPGASTVTDFRVLSLEDPEQSQVAAHQIIYVNKGASDGIEPGQEWGIFRKGDKIKNAHARKESSQSVYPIYRIGRAKVLAAQPESAVMRITYSCRETQRDDFLAPWEEMAIPIHIPRVFERTTFMPDKAKPQARVVYNGNDKEAVARGDLLAVNLGRNDGLDAGDYLTTYFPVKEKSFERYEVAGEMVILHAGDSFSTCKFVTSYRETHVGDMVEPQ
jgi:hypothetical protein